MRRQTARKSLTRPIPNITPSSEIIDLASDERTIIIDQDSLHLTAIENTLQEILKSDSDAASVKSIRVGPGPNARKSIPYGRTVYSAPGLPTVQQDEGYLPRPAIKNPPPGNYDADLDTTFDESIEPMPRPTARKSIPYGRTLYSAPGFPTVQQSSAMKNTSSGNYDADCDTTFNQSIEPMPGPTARKSLPFYGAPKSYLSRTTGQSVAGSLPRPAIENTTSEILISDSDVASDRSIMPPPRRTARKSISSSRTINSASGKLTIPSDHGSPQRPAIKDTLPEIRHPNLDAASNPSIEPVSRSTARKTISTLRTHNLASGEPSPRSVQEESVGLSKLRADEENISTIPIRPGPDVSTNALGEVLSQLLAGESTSFLKNGNSASKGPTITSIQDFSLGPEKLHVDGENIPTITINSKPGTSSDPLDMNAALIGLGQILSQLSARNITSLPKTINLTSGGRTTHTIQDVSLGIERLCTGEKNISMMTNISEPSGLITSLDQDSSLDLAIGKTRPGISGSDFYKAFVGSIGCMSLDPRRPIRDEGNTSMTTVSSDSGESSPTLDDSLDDPPDNPPDNQPDNPPDNSRAISARPSKMSLTKPSPNWTIEKELSWYNKLHESGLFIICSNKQCGKLRYLKDCHDPTEIPQDWECSYQKGRSCDDPQEHIDEDDTQDLIENLYTAGSLVWAKCQSFPWWPAIVCDDPATMSYYQLRENSYIPEKYHVLYFEYEGQTEFEYDWHTPEELKPFNPEKTPPNEMLKEPDPISDDLKKRKRRAYELCKKIYNNKMPISERLEKYGYMAVLKSKEKSVEKEKKSSPKKRTTRRGRKGKKF